MPNPYPIFDTGQAYASGAQAGSSFIQSQLERERNQDNRTYQRAQIAHQQFMEQLARQEEVRRAALEATRLTQQQQAAQFQNAVMEDTAKSMATDAFISPFSRTKTFEDYMGEAVAKNVGLAPTPMFQELVPQIQANVIRRDTARENARYRADTLTEINRHNLAMEQKQPSTTTRANPRTGIVVSRIKDLQTKIANLESSQPGTPEYDAKLRFEQQLFDSNRELDALTNDEPVRSAAVANLGAEPTGLNLDDIQADFERRRLMVGKGGVIPSPRVTQNLKEGSVVPFEDQTSNNLSDPETDYEMQQALAKTEAMSNPTNQPPAVATTQKNPSLSDLKLGTVIEDAKGIRWKWNGSKFEEVVRK